MSSLSNVFNLPKLIKELIPKKAPWCIFLRRPPGRWENMNPAGNSARRCGKAAKKYMASGIPDIDICIYPKGISPP